MFGNIGGQHTILEDDNPVLLKAVKFLVPLVEKYANDEISLAELRDLKTDKLAMYKKEATANTATPSDTVVNRTRNVVVKQEKKVSVKTETPTENAQQKRKAEKQTSHDQLPHAQALSTKKRPAVEEERPTASSSASSIPPPKKKLFKASW